MRILIVDDEEGMRSLLEDFLGELNHGVLTATNGEEALARLRQAKVDVVMTDRSMPVMSGDELVRRISRERPHLPIIMLTADVLSGEQREELIKAGVVAFIKKPFNLSSLADVLGHL